MGEGAGAQDLEHRDITLQVMKQLVAYLHRLEGVHCADVQTR